MTDGRGHANGPERFWHRHRWVAGAAALGLWLPYLRIIRDAVWDSLGPDAQIALVACVWTTLLVLGLRRLLGWLRRALSAVTRGRGDEPATGRRGPLSRQPAALAGTGTRHPRPTS